MGRDIPYYKIFAEINKNIFIYYLIGFLGFLANEETYPNGCIYLTVFFPRVSQLNLMWCILYVIVSNGDKYDLSRKSGVH